MENQNTSDFEKDFLKMRTSGLTVRDIAQRLRKSTNTICRLNKKYFRELSDIKNAKIEQLQKLILEQKKERLDFFKTQLYLLNEKIYKSEIILRYEEMIKLAVRLSDAINKCERETLLDLITPGNIPVTDVISESPAEPADNNEVNEEENTSDNSITKNSKKEKNNNDNSSLKAVNTDKNNINSSDPPPRTKADFYRRVLKTPAPPT